MTHKIIYPSLLLFTLFMGEFHNVVATDYINEKSLFLLIDLKQDLEWYVKDTMEGLIWLIFLWVWYKRESKKDEKFANFILVFFIFRMIDLICYWLNHRHAGEVYFFTYLSIAIYGIGNIIKYRRNQ